jgi:hypothetical protein
MLFAEIKIVYLCGIYGHSVIAHDAIKCLCANVRYRNRGTYNEEQEHFNNSEQIKQRAF